MVDRAPFAPIDVILIAWNRPESLQRLVRSLSNAEYDTNARISLTFALDFAGNSSVDAAIDAIADSLSTWPYGVVRVQRRRERAGLRDNVLGAWRPGSDDDPPAVFLEDDIEVSPLWWHWLQACLRQYAASPSLLGVSLFTPDEMNEPFLNSYRRLRDGREIPMCGWQAQHARTKGRNATSAVLFGQPMSWGALYFANGWRRFLRHAASLRAKPVTELPRVGCPEWLHAEDPHCDHRRIAVNRWGASSWKRLLVLHMLSEGLYMVYPNMPGRTSFSTNHVEQGVHVRSEAVLQGQRSRHRVRLVTRDWCAAQKLKRCDNGGDDAFELPRDDAIGLYDFYCERHQEPSAMRDVGAKLRAVMPPPVDEDDAAAAPVDERIVVGGGAAAKTEL